MNFIGTLLHVILLTLLSIDLEKEENNYCYLFTVASHRMKKPSGVSIRLLSALEVYQWNLWKSIFFVFV